MKEIHQAQQALDHAKNQLKSAVQQARNEGHTWAAIGETLGMSRQAAFKRFGEVTNPVTGRTIKGAPMSIAQIQQTTENVFDLISEGKSEELQEILHPEVREELNPSLIAETWARVLGEVGTKEAYSDTHVVLPAGERIEEDVDIVGTVVGVTTLNCEAGVLMGRVAIDDQLRVVGILIVPPDHGPVPF
ncbi:MAG: hypothetical protein ACTHZ9_03650 [Leucobacter sp.]